VQELELYSYVYTKLMTFKGLIACTHIKYGIYAVVYIISVLLNSIGPP